jgi:hypothetical protein
MLLRSACLGIDKFRQIVTIFGLEADPVERRVGIRTGSQQNQIIVIFALQS